MTEFWKMLTSLPLYQAVIISQRIPGTQGCRDKQWPSVSAPSGKVGKIQKKVVFFFSFLLKKCILNCLSKIAGLVERKKGES